MPIKQNSVLSRVGNFSQLIVFILVEGRDLIGQNLSYGCRLSVNNWLEEGYI